MHKLEIPDAAYVAADASLGDEHAVVRAAAPIIVATELRRIADELDEQRREARRTSTTPGVAFGFSEAANFLRKRADELAVPESADTDGRV